MVIAIEAQRIFRLNKHGMDFVVLEQIRRLQVLDRDNTYYIIVAKGPDKCLTDSDNMKIVELGCPSYPLWEQWALARYVNRLKPDLLHCTSNTAPVNCRVPLVLTLHDIIFLEKSARKNRSLYQRLGRLYRRLVVPKILPKCSKIITVSNFECSRIGEALQLPEDRITSLYNACADHFKPTGCRDSVRERYLLPQKYMFFLGNTDPKKNSDNLLKAYALANSRCNDLPDLVVADLTDEMKQPMLERLGVKDLGGKIHFLGYLPNAILPDVYCGAEVFLYPSLRESFGIPMLETMACETPLLTSDTSAMPEIAGDAAHFVDPTSVESITEGILKLHNDKSYCEELVRRGRERVKRYSWSENARQLLEIYKQVAKQL